MDDFRQKQKMRRIMYSKWTFVILGALLCFVLWKTWGIYQKERLARTILEESRLEHDILAARADELSYDIDQLNTDVGLEAVVRDRYGVAKKGEQVIVLVDDNTFEKDSDKENLGFWARIKAFFGDKE